MRIVVRSTGRSSPPSGSGSRMRSPTSSRPARRCAKQGLEIFGPVILESTAVLIARNADARGPRHPAPSPAGRDGRPPVRARWTTTCRPHLVDAASKITPGLESPTVSPLRDSDWVAVRVDGAAGRDQPRHGRAVRARRARDPGQRDPRRADLSRGASQRASSPASTSPPAASSRASTSSTCATRVTRSSWRARYYEQGADEITFLDVTATVDRPRDHVRDGDARPPSRSSSR